MPTIIGTFATGVTHTTSRQRVLTFGPGAVAVPLAQDEMDRIGGFIDEQLTSGNLTGYSVEDDNIANNRRTRYLYALGGAAVHMQINQENVPALPVLPGTATQAQANARANALKVAWNAHVARVGTFAADGPHKTADATNVIAAADASGLASCITLINALLAAVIGHGNQATVHFANDTGAGGTGAAITTDPPTTLAHCITDLNDLRTAFMTHFQLSAL